MVVSLITLRPLSRTRLSWLITTPLLFLLAPSGWAKADLDAPPSPVRTQLVPAVVREEGNLLQRALLGRLEFEQLGIHLVGIAILESRPACFIKHPGSSNQMIYAVGDVIGGFRIEAVENTSVTFERDGLRMWLMLGETSDGRHQRFAAEEEEFDAEPVDPHDLEVQPASPLSALAEAPEAVPADVQYKFPRPAQKIKTRRFTTAQLIEDGSNTKSRPLRSRRLAATRMFDSPMSGRLTSRYGYRRHPMGGDRVFHRGIDIAARYGTEVHAAADGVVKSSSRSYTYGKFVIIKHAYGYETLYGHLSDRKVKVGQKIQQGQVIGEEGSTGRSTGPHLHFEIRKNGKTYNPLSYIRVRH